MADARVGDFHLLDVGNGLLCRRKPSYKVLECPVQFVLAFGDHENARCSLAPDGLFRQGFIAFAGPYFAEGEYIFLLLNCGTVGKARTCTPSV